MTDQQEPTDIEVVAERLREAAGAGAVSADEAMRGLRPSGDVTAAIERMEVRRARSHVYGDDGTHSLSADAFALLAEVERLRAEREALRSDETRAKVAATIAHLRMRSQGWSTSSELADAVLSVLSAAPEADALIDCPHWEPGRITKRKGCTSCAAEADQ